MSTDLEQQIAAQTTEIADLRSQVEFLLEVQEQRDRLQSLIEDLESDLSAVQQELHHLRQERASDGAESSTGGNAERELANLRVRYKALAEQFGQTRSGREDMESRLAQLETENQEHQAMRDRMATSLAAAQEQARTYEARLKRQESEHARELAKLRSVIQEMQAKAG